MKIGKLLTLTLLVASSLFMLQNCTIVRPGEVAVVVKFGKMKKEIWESGMHARSVIGINVIRYSTRITDYSAKLNLPTKEGLEVFSDVTLLYHVDVDSVKSIYLKFGTDYHTFVKNNVAASSREIFAEYFVKDIITARHDIEIKIFDRISAVTHKYGIIIDQMLLRDIILPAEYEQAIKNKVNAEQLAMQTKFDIDKQRMELEYSIEKQRIEADWSIEKQKKEAERMQIEANAIKKYQDTVNTSLTEMYIKYKSLEITEGLVTSPNSKVIITNGSSPVILDPDK
jgi:prohibitin 1